MADTNHNASVTYNATRAVALLNLATQARNGGQARAIMAMLLALRSEVIRADDVSAYLRSDKRKEKTAYMNKVLDDVFAFDHSADGNNKAETRTRALISSCLPVALYLHLSVKHPPAMMKHPRTGEDMVVPTEPRVELEVHNDGKATERCYLKVPGNLVFKADEKRGEAHYSDPCIKLDGTGGKTVDTLKTRADAYLFPASPSTGAQNSNATIREKKLKEISPSDLASEMAKQVRNMDSGNIKPMVDSLRELQAELRAKLPIGMGMDEDEGGQLIELEDVTELVQNYKSIKNASIKARLAILYDALDVAMKDDEFFNAAEAARKAA